MKRSEQNEIGRTFLPRDNVLSESKTSRLQFCYDVIREAYNFTFQNRTNLDEKASKIIIFSGIIMSVYSGIGSLFLKDLAKTESIVINKYIFLVIVLFLGILSLFISIILALKAYKPEIWTNVPSAKPFHEKYVIDDKDKDFILGKLTASTVEAITFNETKLSDKVKYINNAFKALQIGIVLCAGFMFIAII